MINGHRLPSSDGLMQELENGGSHGNGTSFYKLEMINIQLLAPHGQQVYFAISCMHYSCLSTSIFHMEFCIFVKALEVFDLIEGKTRC